MATSLQAQLAQVAARSKSTLDVKTQKAAHSKSLIWEPRIAATQSYQTLYTTCFQGFEELCQLDGRFARFQDTIFSEESQDQDRTQLTEGENAQLDQQVEAFLRLAGSRLRLMPAIKSIEWLIRRFRIHQENTTALLLTFLPYHSITAFTTLLSILPSQLPSEFKFLDPYVRSVTSPSRSFLVHQAIQHPEFLTLVSEYTLASCRMQYQYPALISFWGGFVTEALSGIVDRNKSGRASIQSENDQALLHRLGPVFAESLVAKKVPSLQIASYMALSVFVSKSNLEDSAVTAFMEQLVQGWTNDTVKPGLVCLAIMAQYRSAKQMSGRVTKALMKVPSIGPLLVEIGQDRRIDKLCNGFCLALIERLSKKSDPRGLPTIMAVLSSNILKEKQIAVNFKFLILAALRLDDENDEEGILRREIGSSLIALSQISGSSGDIIQSVIHDTEFDIEELEMKLDLSFRSRNLIDNGTQNAQEEKPAVKEPKDLNLSIDEISKSDGQLSQCLTPQPSEIFDEFSHLFFSIVSQQTKDQSLLDRFDQIKQLGRKSALQDSTYCSFFISIFAGPYPALARASALNMIKARLTSDDAVTVDLQALVPYCVAALGDPSKRVRRAAADLLSVIAGFYTPSLSSKSLKSWGAGLYSSENDVSALGIDIFTRFLHLQLIPALEACVLDAEHVYAIVQSSIDQGRYGVHPDPALDKKDHLSHSGRSALLSFLASHAVATPLITVKDRLLKCLNGVRGVSGISRTKLLLPALEWWVSLSEQEALAACLSGNLDKTTLDSRFVDVVVSNDVEGLDFLFRVFQDPATRQSKEMTHAMFGRIRQMWPQMKENVQFSAAERLLDLSQEDSESVTDPVVAGEAADLLRGVPLTTDILSYFLNSIHTGTKMITEPPPNKRRRTSSSEASRGAITQVTPELSKALRKVTFVLQIVESSDPVSHPELLDGLFTALSELQHFRTVVGSELGYLQNLILRSILAMMPAYKANKDLKIDSSGGYGDLLVNCIQKSSSPVVQNAALLLVASLATIAPHLVLHSVMPIFTFMGTSVLRQSDDYSAHIVSQTIKEVVPPLIQSLRSGKKSPVAGASDILVSFTTAYEHIPSHRRLGMFMALVETLGDREFLFALISMLVDRYGPSEALLQFVVELLNKFNSNVQLETLVNLVDIISDLFEAKPELALVLLGGGEEGDEKDIEQIAGRQLSALPNLISSRRLKGQMEKLDGREDMEASQIRELYATLLEKVLLLADTVKANKSLHGRCGSALSGLLNLLSVSEFIKAVESLLDRPEMGLRQKVLRSLEVRVESESNTNVASRTALLAFLPELTAAIRESDDIRYKYTAVTCVDKIAEKYGKKDIEAVVAAAMTIAGDDCLGHSDQRLRVMALLCLTSLVDVLQDAIVPVLPTALPRVVSFLESSLAESEDEELHAASFGFVSCVAEYLPYMLTTYLDRLFAVASVSAEAELASETVDARVNCLRFVARSVDAKEVFASLERSWDSARGAGFKAIAQFIDIFGTAIDKHGKPTVAKHATLLSGIVTKMFDLRRQVQTSAEVSTADLDTIAAIEESVYGQQLKMIYKLNDAAFRPIFVQLMDWVDSNLPKSDKVGRVHRQYTLYGFLKTFFESLKSIVTNYATYVVEDAVKVLNSVHPKRPAEHLLWSRVLETLTKSFEHDQDDFWQAPAHFGTIAPVLLKQFTHASTIDVEKDLIPAFVELAAAADSQAHQKELNGGLMKHLKSEQGQVRLAAIRCEEALTDRLGEEWLTMLHEMLPKISELQDDDDDSVERATHSWILKIEGVLGESLDAMLQ